MSEDALIVITSAVKTAFIDHPGSGHGTTWDQVTKSDEESIHLAKACAGCSSPSRILRYQGRGPECPEALKARSSCRRDRRCHLPVPRLLARRLIGVAGEATLAANIDASRVCCYAVSSRQDGPHRTSEKCPRSRHHSTASAERPTDLSRRVPEFR